MTWFAFKGYQPIELAGAQEKEATALGFHGYATLAQATSHPNSVNVLQKAYVNILEADYKQAKSVGQQPGGPNANLANPAADLRAGGAEAANLAGLPAIGDFFNRLTQAHTWLRVGEVVAGLILLYVGLNAAFRGTGAERAVHSATRGAKRTAEVIGIPK